MKQPPLNIQNTVLNNVVIHQAANFQMAKDAVTTLVNMHVGELTIMAGTEEDEECDALLVHVSTFNFKNEEDE